MPQPIHPNPPSVGNAPGDRSSTAAKICAHVQNLFPPPFVRGRPLVYRHVWLSAPVPPWMTTSPGDAAQLGGEEWIRSEHRTRWPSPATFLGLPAAPSNAGSSGKSFYRILACHFTGMLPQVLRKGGLPALEDQPFKPHPCLKSLSISLFDCGLKKKKQNKKNKPQTNLPDYSVTGSRRITASQHLNQEKISPRGARFPRSQVAKLHFLSPAGRNPQL